MDLRRCKIVAFFMLGAALSACGGGGGGGSEPAQPAAVAPAAPIVTPAAPACTPQPVDVLFVGDSTNVALLPTGALAVNSPWMIVRDAMLHAYGHPVSVESRAVGHMTTRNLLQGNDGVNKPWPGGVPAGAITVANFGINDSIRWSLDEYKADLRKLHPTYFETPNPTDAAVRPHEQTQAYVQAMREVAAELGVPVIDVNAYVLGLPGWRGYLADGIHPSDELYGMIARNVVLPALLPVVAKARCE